MLRQDLKKLNLFNPFKNYNIKKAVLKQLWNGSYFYDDLNKSHHIAGDANTFPFWCNLTTSKKRFISCLTHMQNAKLTKPFPLKYNSGRAKCSKMHFLEMFAGDYERDSIFMHISLCFMDVLKKYNKQQFNRHMAQYADLIKKHKNFLEIYNYQGLPFKNLFYITDESMLWASKYLHLKKK